MSTDNPLIHPSAPADERYDAEIEIAKSQLPLANELMTHAERLVEFYQMLSTGLGEDQIAKSARPIAMNESTRHRLGRQQGMRSLWLDDIRVNIQGDYVDRASPLSFTMLRRITEQTPILNAIVMTRVRQVKQFCKPADNDLGRGFTVVHRDKSHKVTADERRAIEAIKRFINYCGWEYDPSQRRRLKRDTFAGFMAKRVRDSLIMDAAPIELEHKRARGRGLDGFYAVDGATIYLCTEDGYEGNDEIFALQVVDGMPRTTYTYDDLIYEVRNPRTDLEVAGYGLGETELLTQIVTGFLNAMTVNIKGFDSNSIPQGFLQLYGDYSQTELTAFKQYWNALVRGVQNRWAAPLLVSEGKESGAEFVRTGVEYDEMYFSKWMTFLTSIACAIYGMAPDEINFESFAASKSTLSGEDTAEKLADSKDKGLRPMLEHEKQVISDAIIAKFSPNLELHWAGLDPVDEQRRFEERKLTLTVDEVRSEAGYDPMADKTLGNAPVNPSLLMLYQQSIGQDQSEFGDPEAGDEFGDQPAQGQEPEPGPEPQEPEQQPDPMGKSFGMSVYRVEL